MKTDRRSFFKTAGVSAFGLSMASPFIAEAAIDPIHEASEKDQVLFVGDNIAVAETAYGKVRGVLYHGVNQFLGIPYAADTSGAGRFKPARKPESWSETFPALWWPNSAPQTRADNRYNNKYSAFRDCWNYDAYSEDCLGLNIWTQGINDGKNRPVMFWIHGGGFGAGSSFEMSCYHGLLMTKRSDVVFVSINHRLGALGYTNLAGFGGKDFEASGNLSMLDVVFALEWVRENIANFGGDPDNVTIMGQSGGGSKVTTLMAMPSAKGLFHKAVALSGGARRLGDKEASEKLGGYILREAGLTSSQIDKLQAIPWEQYQDIASRASSAFNQDNNASGGPGGGGFRPVVDGTVIPQHPEDSSISSNIPLIICSTFNESSPTAYDAKLDAISLDGVKEQLKGRFGADAGKVVDAYAGAFPSMRPADIWSMAVSARTNAIAIADGRTKQSQPVYLAWFGWQPPLFDSRARAHHCVDIGFWFYNTDFMLSHTGGGARPRSLSAKMSDTLVQFMKTGSPNGGGLPNWPKYTSEKGETMVLNDKSELKNDPDRQARNAIPTA